MSRALYRKYRSKSLDEVVGQKHITDILKRSLEKGILSHAYLLTGPRGVGKTSIARILAHEINGLPYTDESSHLDIIEIDAASNNGVEDVRELRDKVQIAPSSAKKKIYIIDEVHMLSKPAFNALLKTLEEPPEHVVFILATTDIDKLPATIISRTQRFTFRPVPMKDVADHLEMIATEEKIDIERPALELIARRGQGSFRDSISLLDQVSGIGAGSKISAEQIADSLGLAPAEAVSGILDASDKKDIAKLVELLDRCEQTGVDPNALIIELSSEIKNRLANKPALAELLNQLLDANKSSDPYLKLLAVLVAHGAKHSPKVAALSANAPSVSAPIKELEQAATKKTPVVAPPPKPQKPIAAKQKQADNKTAEPVEIKRNVDAPTDFDWASLVEYTRQNYVAIYSVLSACSYEINDNVITIYAGNAFYKKKLDDMKYRTSLAQALAEVCSQELTIDVVPTKAPPKDEQAAAVAAIMGGGEEVSVDI